MPPGLRHPLALAGLLMACSTSSPPVEPEKERPFALLYSGNLDGETEPCG